MTVLLTGASGFVGCALLFVLQKKRRLDVRAVFRNAQTAHGSGQNAASVAVVSSLSAETDWRVALIGAQVVVHAAARAHVMDETVADPLSAFRAVNVDGTLNLARQAAQAGVRRFIFISSIKVNGEQTPIGSPFTEQCIPSPEDPYGVSKCEAEMGLLDLASTSSMEIVIIRPPLIYGPGVKGNLQSLLKLAKSGLPLPLGAVRNLRSMIYLGNLVDLILKCIDSPAAANQVFLASDAHDISTSELLRLIRTEMGLPHRLMPVPPAFLYMLGRISGKSAVVDRLCGSLQVDCSKARQLLGWQPPYSVEHGVSEMVKDFMKSGL